MKSFIIGMLAVLFMVGVSESADWITCDPQDGVLKYSIRLSSDGGTTWGTWVDSDALAGGVMRHDISAVEKGQYKGEAIAGGLVEVTDTATGTVSQVMRWSGPAGFSLRVLPGNAPAKLSIGRDAAAKGIEPGDFKGP